MRRTVYVGVSVGATAAIVLRAFHERPNFYSATVYLGQSTACRMILLNMLLLTLASSIYGLQRLLYGPLRAIEIEQLWDKAWYAITETALAMTTFRDEVGGYFFFMFMTLLAGKVWGWIGEGRVEIMEQQPPANPKTFYARLTTSLILSELFDILMLRYCMRTILDQQAPRAGMMIMFVFEFAILAIHSASTLARYGLALWERWVITEQTVAKMEERREEIRAERARAAGRIVRSNARSNVIDDIEIDENEIDVPGWQEKGKWVLFLDLTTDFLKLVLYMTFFLILIMFAGIPIHMFRDLFITTRSFLKRINDYLKYRNATRDMNSRYPDATVEELRRDGTCIICREEMRPWQTPRVVGGAAEADRAPNSRSPLDERHRPKKLPCGHILHFGCLRSWLERQQVCPTCRRSVLASDTTRQDDPQLGQGNAQQPNAGNNQNRGQQQQQQQQPPGHGHRPHNQQAHPDQRGQGNAPGVNRLRTFSLGPFRLTLATGRGINVRDVVNQAQNQANQGQTANRSAPASVVNNQQQPAGDSNISAELANLEQRLTQQIGSLALAHQELNMVRVLQNEIARLRTMQQAPRQGSMVTGMHYQQIVHYGPNGAPPTSSMPAPEQQVMTGAPPSDVLRAGDSNLPNGMTLPEGWSMLPLNRWNPMQPMGQPAASNSTPSSNSVAQPTATTQRSSEVRPALDEQPGPVNSEGMPVDAPDVNGANGARNSTRFNSQESTETSSHVTSVPQAATDPGGQDEVTSHDSIQNELGQSQQGDSATQDASTREESDVLPQQTSTGHSSSKSDIPDWGANSGDVDGPSTNGHTAEEKGKSRTAQVEDAPDDEA